MQRSQMEYTKLACAKSQRTANNMEMAMTSGAVGVRPVASEPSRWGQLIFGKLASLGAFIGAGLRWLRIKDLRPEGAFRAGYRPDAERV
jgi:hypothetical protein